MPPVDEGGFQGINPSMLSQLIKSLASGVNGAQPVAASYVGQFNRCGLGTGAVNKLLADYSWASSQQPMLQRRYSLASHQPPGSWVDGWTSEGAGALAFATTGAAKKAGANDAKQMSAYLQAHDQAGIQKMLDAMARSEGDSDYMAAFFSQLGPSGLYSLAMLAQEGGSKDKDTADEVKWVVGNGLASASYEMTLTRGFLQGIEPDLERRPPGYSPEMLPGGWDSGMLAPFLTQGEYSSQWLNVIAPTVLYRKSVEMGAPLPGGYDAIFQAIGNNPGFAAGFYHQNADQLNEYMTDPLLQNYLAKGQGFGHFLEAATIPPSGAASTKPFTENATEFIKLFSGGADTNGTVRQVMAAVTVNYFSDLTGTITAAAPAADGKPSVGSPLGLTADEWGKFVEESMKDKTSAAFILTNYASWRSEQEPFDNLPTSGQGDGPDTPTHAGYWVHSSLGALDYFFASNYQAAGASAGQGNDLLKILIDAADAGGATLLTSVVFPEAAPFVITTEVLAEAGKDAFSSAAESVLGKITEPLTETGNDGGPGADGLAKDLTDVQSRWSSMVHDTWNQSQPTPGHANPKDFPPVWYNGVQYTADPQQYEHQYGGTFTNADGTVMDLPDIQRNPKALAAYNAWLQDPAISNVVAGSFQAESQGSFNSFYAHQMAGAGGGGG